MAGTEIDRHAGCHQQVDDLGESGTADRFGARRTAESVSPCNHAVRTGSHNDDCVDPELDVTACRAMCSNLGHGLGFLLLRAIGNAGHRATV